MLVARLAKIAMIAALAAFALMVAYNNVFDYDSNYQFFRHVLSMDTIFPDSALRSRAIDNQTVWHAAYVSIITAEVLAGLLLALGAIVLLWQLRSPAKVFNDAKLWAVAGLTIGFGLWFFGFIVVGGEYFAMWQSKDWNGQEGAFRFVTISRGLGLRQPA